MSFGQRDVAEQRVALADVFHGPGGVGLGEGALGLDLRGGRVPGRQQRLGEIRGRVDRPAPAVGAVPELLDPRQRLLEMAHRARRFAERQIVEADVDRGADLDVGVVDASGHVEALAIVLVSPPEVAQLLVEPAKGVDQPALEEGIVAVAGLAERVVELGQGFRVVAERDVGEAGE